MKLRKTLFWDSKLQKIDLERNSQYVIERVLDYGNDEEVRWLYNYYDKKLLKSVVAKSRTMRPKTKNLWTLILNTE